MTIEDSGPNSSSDHIMDWLDGSISFLPSVLDDIYNPVEIGSDDWWVVHNQDFDHDALYTSSTSTTPTNLIVPNSPQLSDSSKKRKPSDGAVAGAKPRKNQSRRSDEEEEEVEETGAATVAAKRSTGGSKRKNGRNGGGNCNNGNSREGRWAEQLLNPCAAAITAGNLTRVHHLLYVLHELASPAGDANHRLAAHGLKALTNHLSTGHAGSGQQMITFATTKPQAFQKSLMRFDEVSPYFMFPNKIANASILQILSEQQGRKNNNNNNSSSSSSSTTTASSCPPLHILDIGVSHGIQWPTLFEALTRRPGGSPPLVRLTIVSSFGGGGVEEDGPFSTGPPGHSNTPQLLGFAKSMNLNLQINRLDKDKNNSTRLLQDDLNTQMINSSPDETLIVCAQFRLHQLSHENPKDERSDLLKVIRGMRPKGVILSENNCECSCLGCNGGDYSTGFKRRVEFLWRFLDSTSTAFKGRESDERRVMEGEAAKALTSMCEMNEGRDKWCDRMRRCGFVPKGFGEDVIDEARALLRKYDGGWEMRTDNIDDDDDNNNNNDVVLEERERLGCVGLWWKSQPVSFCSLWGLI